jgi:hypothetical protein
MHSSRASHIPTGHSSSCSNTTNRSLSKATGVALGILAANTGVAELAAFLSTGHAAEGASHGMMGVERCAMC